MKNSAERLSRERCEHAIGVLQRVIANEFEQESLRVAASEELGRLQAALKDPARLGRIFRARENAGGLS
jgi:hypothetical protein